LKGRAVKTLSDFGKHLLGRVVCGFLSCLDVFVLARLLQQLFLLVVLICEYLMECFGSDSRDIGAASCISEPSRRGWRISLF